MFKRLLLTLALAIWTFFSTVSATTDIEFEITTISTNFLRLIAREKTNIVFDQTINFANFTGKKHIGTSYLSATTDGLLFKYKGAQGLKFSFAINNNGDIQTVVGNHETAFKAQKTWGFKTPGKFINAVPSLFYQLNVNAHETHNRSILKAYTGNFSQNYLFNDGVFHFGDLDDCLSEAPYLTYLALTSEAEPDFQYGIIDDHGAILVENGLSITNLTHKAYGITDITGPLLLNNASVENHHTYHVAGLLSGNCHSLTNHHELFLHSLDSKITNLVNYGRIDIATTSTLSVSDLFDNGALRSESEQVFKLGIIHCGGSLTTQFAKKPKGLGIITADALKTIIDEFLDEAALKNAFSTGALLPKNRKLVRKVYTHVDHYLNTITTHNTHNQYGHASSHKTETGYQFQKRDTSISEKTIDTPEWPEGYANDNAKFANKRDLFKGLKDHLKQALKKLAQGQVHKGTLAKTLHEALAGAGFSETDIEDFFDDSEIQGLFQNLTEFDEDSLKTLDEKLQTQANLSRGNLVESLLGKPNSTPNTVVNKSVYSPSFNTATSTLSTFGDLTPRRRAALLGFAHYNEIFNKLDKVQQAIHQQRGYEPEAAAMDYYEATQHNIALAALWKGLTGKTVSAYEQEVVADFAMNIAIKTGFESSALVVQKIFGRIVNASIGKIIGATGKSQRFANELAKKSSIQPLKKEQSYKITDTRSDPSLPVGRRGTGQKPKYLTPNEPTKINGRNYTDHALDEMRQEGFTPSVVENALKSGEKYTGIKLGRVVHYDKVNNISVVLESDGITVVTVSSGKLKIG